MTSCLHFFVDYYRLLNLRPHFNTIFCLSKIKYPPLKCASAWQRWCEMVVEIHWKHTLNIKHTLNMKLALHS
jgi:hypothetical protein